MKTIEVHISDIIIQHPEIDSFVELMDFVGGGEVHNHGDTTDELGTWAPKYATMILATKD